MAKLTMDKAERLIRANVTEAHLFTHALAVSSAMGAMAQNFGEDKAHWQAVGYLHDVDYEKFPQSILPTQGSCLKTRILTKRTYEPYFRTGTAYARMLNR